MEKPPIRFFIETFPQEPLSINKPFDGSFKHEFSPWSTKERGLKLGVFIHETEQL